MGHSAGRCCCFEKGFQEGCRKGFAEGFEKGCEQGFQEGLEKGARCERERICRQICC